MKLNIHMYIGDINISVYLTQGEHDDNLVWPFSGSIKIELLNQKHNNYHYTETVKVASAERVDPTKKEGSLIGETAFDLPDKKEHYYPDGTLYFRVTVNYRKSWLVCSTVATKKDSLKFMFLN